MTASRIRKRRKRRQQRAALRHGKAAKPTHKLKSGRTGSAHSKKSPGRRADREGSKTTRQRGLAQRPLRWAVEGTFMYRVGGGDK